jgi:methionyl-tRNA formyltransferase
MSDQLSVVFMGSASFAVPSLDLLHQKYQVKAVITAPDKPAGRGLRLRQTPVKEWALANQLYILQPLKLKDPAFLQKLQELRPELQVVVAFRMLPEVVWSMPPLGTVNLHASLLPDYRGPAPIPWAIIQGEKTTGLTTFRLRQDIDTGPVLFTESLDILDGENAGDLQERMKVVGAKLLLKTVEALASGKYTETPQEFLPQPSTLHPAPKLYREDGRIEWSRPAKEILQLIRGLSPQPGAWTMIGETTVKILEAEADTTLQQRPGQISTDQKSFLKFSAADGGISVKALQPEGKKKLAVAEFLRGFRQF